MHDVLGPYGKSMRKLAPVVRNIFIQNYTLLSTAKNGGADLQSAMERQRQDDLCEF